MKVLPLSTDEYNLEIRSDNKISKLEACNLGIFNNNANDNIKIDNAFTMMEQGIDFDLYVAEKLSGIYEPNCVSKNLYQTGIEYTNYFINTIERFYK